LKKAWTALLTVSLLLLCLPMAPRARAAESDQVIDMHGTKTYIGSSSNWSKTWDPDNFTDVTDKDAPNCSGNLTVKAGSVKGVTVEEGGKLTVTGGTVGDADCGGSVSITGGTVKSVVADGDISVKDGTIRHDVESDDGEISLSGKVSVGGSIKGKDISILSSATVKVSGSITGTDSISLTSCSLKTKSIEGSKEGTLKVNGYTGEMPVLHELKGISLSSKDKLILDQKVSAETLYLPEGAELVTYSTLDLDTLEGPGTLCCYSGKLTLHEGAAGTPKLVFLNPVGNGTVAFQADESAVSPSDIQVFGYDLDSSTSGGEDLFKLALPSSEGIKMNKSSVAVSSKTPQTISASVHPSLSQYADGTKVVWKLYGDSSAFSISADSSKNSCTVSASESSGRHRAVLVVYLADRLGNCLSEYRADSCIVTTGYDEQAADLTLDTSEVSLLVGNKYGVLAKTSAALMPEAVSYNPSIATVSAGKAVKNPGWLYTVTGVSAGSTIIDIAGQQMSVTVNSGVLLDTASYTLRPGASYCMGLLVRGLGGSDLNVSATNSSCVGIQLYRTGSDGMRLYRITGKNPGTSNIVFQVSGGEKVQAKVTVANGAKPSGKSARLVALKR
jgi:hypothetical protein